MAAEGMGNYNATGILQNTPAPGAGKARDANAEVKVDASQIDKLDALQMLLDVVGLIPAAGAPADILNALISAARGDWLGAGLSIVGVVPIAGEAATAGKIAKNAERYTAAVQTVSEKVIPHLPKSAQKKLREVIESAEAKIDELAGRPPKAKEKPKEPPKAKDEGRDGVKVDPKRQKPHQDCGKVSTYSKAPKKLGELNADHLPSGAALKAAAETYLRKNRLFNKLSATEVESVLNKVYNHAKTITIPEDVHKEGRTWGSKNKPLATADSQRLKEAFREDAAAIQKSMDTKDHGCSDKYRDAVKELEDFDFDRYVEDSVKGHKAVAKLLKQ